MAQTVKPTRENRTITVDFDDEATYFQLFDDTKAFTRVRPGLHLLLGPSASPQSELSRQQYADSPLLNKLPDKLVGLAPRCARAYAASFIRCCTAVASAKACG